MIYGIRSFTLKKIRTINMTKQMKSLYVLPVLLIIISNGCMGKQNDTSKETKNEKTMEIKDSTKWDTATFGAGCFWCGEAIFAEIKGVHSVRSGYAGGTTKNPTYNQITSGKTGHAEVTRIIFDPTVTSFKDLLEVFWQIHDPTSLNKQGNDTCHQKNECVQVDNGNKKV